MQLIASLAAAIAGLVLASPAGAAPATLPGPAFPRFADAAALKSACDGALADAGERVERLERHPADAEWLAAWDDLNAAIEDASAPIDLLENVAPEKAIRAKAFFADLER